MSNTQDGDFPNHGSSVLVRPLSSGVVGNSCNTGRMIGRTSLIQTTSPASGLSLLTTDYLFAEAPPAGTTNYKNMLMLGVG